MQDRFSCADFTFPLLPHPEVFDLIKLLGIHAVDLGIFEGRSALTPSLIAGHGAGPSAQALKQALDARGMRASDVFLQTGAEPPAGAVNDPAKATRERNREWFRHLLDFTNALGCTHLTGLPGVEQDALGPEDSWKLATGETAWRVESASNTGLTYAIEPHVGSICPEPDAARRFVEAVPGLTLTLDPGHFIYQDIGEASWWQLCPHTSHVHLRGGAPGRLQTPMSENRIDFARLIRELRASAYTGFLCTEYVYVDWEGCNRTDNVSETLLLKQQAAEALQA